MCICQRESSYPYSIGRRILGVQSNYEGTKYDLLNSGSIFSTWLVSDRVGFNKAAQNILVGVPNILQRDQDAGRR